MKELFFSLLITFSFIAVYSCSTQPKVNDIQLFKTKTGVIGVFRNPSFYCNEASPQYIELGDSLILVKPSWNNEQDNLFIKELPSGTLNLNSYMYECGENKHKLVLDSTKEGASGIVIPENGFCKIVISFLEGDPLFSENEVLLKEFFETNKVAIGYYNLPQCEIINTKGKKITKSLNSDSFLESKFKEALKKVSHLGKDQIYPLVSITTESDKISWNRDSTQVLMLSFHQEPQLYDKDTLQNNEEIWTISEKEFFLWYKNNKTGVKNWELRFKQLLGLNPKEKITHISLLWVKPEDIIRPAYKTQIETDSMVPQWDESFNDYSYDKEFKTSYKKWFDKTKAKSLRPNTGRPWTRLGYTFDWSKTENYYGLTEFLILKDSQIKVQFTKNIPTFIKWLEDKNSP